MAAESTARTSDTYKRLRNVPWVSRRGQRSRLRIRWQGRCRQRHWPAEADRCPGAQRRVGAWRRERSPRGESGGPSAGGSGGRSGTRRRASSRASSTPGVSTPGSTPRPESAQPLEGRFRRRTFPKIQRRSMSVQRTELKLARLRPRQTEGKEEPILIFPELWSSFLVRQSRERGEVREREREWVRNTHRRGERLS